MIELNRSVGITENLIDCELKETPEEAEVNITKTSLTTPAWQLQTH